MKKRFIKTLIKECKFYLVWIVHLIMSSCQEALDALLLPTENPWTCSDFVVGPCMEDMSSLWCCRWWGNLPMSSAGNTGNFLFLSISEEKKKVFARKTFYLQRWNSPLCVFVCMHMRSHTVWLCVYWCMNFSWKSEATSHVKEKDTLLYPLKLLNE